MPGKGFYDFIQLRARTEMLWPAYELLYPRDKLQITAQALRLSGMDGLLALWCDTGERKDAKAEITIRHCIATPAEIKEWCTGLGVPPTMIRSPRDQTFLVRWYGEPARLMMRRFRPLVHVSKRPSLWPGKQDNESLYAWSETELP